MHKEFTYNHYNYNSGNIKKGNTFTEQTNFGNYFFLSNLLLKAIIPVVFEILNKAQWNGSRMQLSWLP